jgi:hypothetical protein
MRAPRRVERETVPLGQRELGDRRPQQRRVGPPAERRHWHRDAAFGEAADGRDQRRRSRREGERVLGDPQDAGELGGDLGRGARLERAVFAQVAGQFAIHLGGREVRVGRDREVQRRP